MLKDTLVERHKEELHDFEVYKQLADENPMFTQIFCDIAREEKSHAELISYILKMI